MIRSTQHLLGKTLRRMRSQILRALLRVTIREYAVPGLLRLGSSYGGWIVPRSALRPGAVCYCGGLGEDGSFDIALSEFACDVHVFDPTPRAIEYASRALRGVSNLTFHAVGLWSESRTMRFYAPANPEHVSHSIANLQRTDAYFDAPCRSVPSLMEELGHEELAILKLDIEGAEREVIRSVISAGLLPEVLCVEVDQPAPFVATWRALRELQRHGYSLCARERWNFTFLTQDP